MDRLTWKDESGYYAPKNVTLNALKKRGELVDRLAAYEDLEEQGRLIVLPCKVGDMVWEIGYDCKIDYEDMCAFPAPSCDECEFVKRIIVPNRVDSVTAATFLLGKIGKTVFFSREEAEAALKGAEDGTTE